MNKKTGKEQWVAQVYWGKDENGKWQRRSKIAKTRKEAVAKLKELQRAWEEEQAALAQEHEAEASWTLTQYLDAWFMRNEAGWAERTKELYKHQIDRHIVPVIGHVPLSKLKPRHVDEMMDKLTKAGKFATANKCRRLLVTALQDAVNREYIPKNPVTAVRPVAEKPTERSEWTTEEAMAFLSYHKDHRWFPAYYLLITSGLRRGELLGLRWTDLDFEQGGLYVRQTVVVVRNQATIGSPKSQASNRYVSLPEDTLEVLRHHKERQDADKALVGGAWEHPELVFPSEIGTLMNPNNFGRTWRKAVKDAGVPHVRVHDMRHMHISLLILRGEDAKTISERAGHSSTSFTLDRYGNAFKQRRAAQARSLQDLLSPSTPVAATRSEEADDSSSPKSDLSEEKHDAETQSTDQENQLSN